MPVSPDRSLVRVPAMLFLAVTLALGSLLVTSPAQAQKIRPNFWGMHDNDWRNPPSVRVGAANLTTSGTYWKSIQPTRSNFNWTKLTEQVQGAEAVSAQPMIVLGGTPKHASPKPRSADFDTYMPRMKAWKLWVTNVVKRYGARLDYQIWPEPNISQNWKGSPRQMALLTAVASQILHKHTSGRAKVVSPALALRLKSQRTWMVKYFKQSIAGKRVHQYVDAIAVDPFPAQTGTPEDSFKLMKAAKRKLARMGVRKPIWNNEINYGVKGGFEDTETTYPVDVQQSFVIRTYALSAAAGMQRTYWLGWFSTDTMAIDMADADGNALQPATSYEVVRSWLNKTNFQGCKKLKSGLWVCTAKKGRREVRRIYWQPRGDTVIRTPRTTRRVEDQEGAVNGDPGARQIRVSYRPIMVASSK